MPHYTDLVSLQADLMECRKCVESGYSIEGMPVFSGSAGARVMLIGQAPGITEAQTRRPFNGEAGRRLFRWLGEAGWQEDSFRATSYMVSVTRCFPGKAAGGTGDRVPSMPEQKLCHDWLEAELALIMPEVIILVGMLAIKQFYPSDVKMDDVIGTSMTDAEGHRIIPLPHPSGASRWHSDPRNTGKLRQAIFALRMLRAELGL
jgi:uracil-DNA glycosylase